MAEFCSREDAAGHFPAVSSLHVMMTMSPRSRRPYGVVLRLMWLPCLVCVSPVTYGQHRRSGVTACGRPGFRAFPVTRADVTLLVDTYDTGEVQTAAGVPSTRPDWRQHGPRSAAGWPCRREPVVRPSQR